MILHMLAAVDGIVGEADTVLRLVLTADHGTVLILVVKKSSQTYTQHTSYLDEGSQ